MVVVDPTSCAIFVAVGIGVWETSLSISVFLKSNWYWGIPIFALTWYFTSKSPSLTIWFITEDKVFLS